MQRVALLALIFPLAAAQCTTCGQQATTAAPIPAPAAFPSGAEVMSPEEMGVRLGREIGLRLSSYKAAPAAEPVQKTYTAADFPPSFFSSLGMQLNGGAPIIQQQQPTIIQAAPQWPMNMGQMVRPMPNQGQLIPKGNCPYCRGNKGK